ncbi:MAG TPA: hypothetical protein VMW10_10370 [Alphaproteobacteria bacterium]|nr:hypothetical protein [Alphaproteobacteria bacterium]
MTFFKTTLFLTGILTSVASYADSTLPDFSTYPVSEIDVLKEKPAPVDLSSHKGAKTYKSKLQEGAEKGPNFAGHYTVVSIGCGTQCQENWVIDAKTGKILDKFPSIVGTKQQVDSTLLIVNPADPELKKAYEEHPEQPLLGEMNTTYEILKDGKFEVIHKDKWVNVIKSLP